MRPALQRLTTVFGIAQIHGIIQVPLTDPCCHGNEVWVLKGSVADINELLSLVDCGECAPWPTRWSLAHSTRAMCGLRAGGMRTVIRSIFWIRRRNACGSTMVPSGTTSVNSRLSAKAPTSTPIRVYTRLFCQDQDQDFFSRPRLPFFFETKTKTFHAVLNCLS